MRKEGKRWKRIMGMGFSSLGAFNVARTSSHIWQSSSKRYPKTGWLAKHQLMNLGITVCYRNRLYRACILRFFLDFLHSSKGPGVVEVEIALSGGD